MEHSQSLQKVVNVEETYQKRNDHYGCGDSRVGDDDVLLTSRVQPVDKGAHLLGREAHWIESEVPGYTEPI